MVANFTSTIEATAEDASPTVLPEHSGPWLHIRGVLLSWPCCHTHGFGAFRPRSVSEALHTLSLCAGDGFHILS